MITSVVCVILTAVQTPLYTILALGEVVVLHSANPKYVHAVEGYLGVVVYNIIQIAHGALDMVPILGNIPYWVEDCVAEGAAATAV